MMMIYGAEVNCRRQKGRGQADAEKKSVENNTNSQNKKHIILPC